MFPQCIWKVNFFILFLVLVLYKLHQTIAPFELGVWGDQICLCPQSLMLESKNIVFYYLWSQSCVYIHTLISVSFQLLFFELSLKLGGNSLLLKTDQKQAKEMKFKELFTFSPIFWRFYHSLAIVDVFRNILSFNLPTNPLRKGIAFLFS